MMVHTITNSMVHSILRNTPITGEGFGHIDMWNFDYSKTYQVVERMINIYTDSYRISVITAYDTVGACLDEIGRRLDERLPKGCYAEYEIWEFQLMRYWWYYGEDKYQADELPYYMCATIVLDEPERTEYFDDAEEWGEYTAQLLNAERYILVDVKVSNVEISYLDTFTEEIIPKRLTKSIPCAMHILKAN